MFIFYYCFAHVLGRGCGGGVGGLVGSYLSCSTGPK